MAKLLTLLLQNPSDFTTKRDRHDKIGFFFFCKIQDLLKNAVVIKQLDIPWSLKGTDNGKKS